jgi:hypothetical protein
MKTLLNANESCQITEANINFYSTPFIHPSRKMSEHDFIYMIDGKWKFGQNEEVFEMQNDTVLLLSANERHYGISPCRANSKTMYFHVSCSSIENEDAILLDSFTDVSSNKNIKIIPYGCKYNKINHKTTRKGLLKVNFYNLATSFHCTFNS